MVQLQVALKGDQYLETEGEALLALEGCTIASFTEVVDKGVFMLEVHPCIWTLLQLQGMIEIVLNGAHGTTTLMAELP